MNKNHIPIPPVLKGKWQRSERNDQVVEVRDKTGWGCTVADCSEGSLPSPDRDKIAKAIAGYPALLRAVVDLVSIQSTTGDHFTLLSGAEYAARQSDVLTALRNSGLNVPKKWKP